jgi:hypothetical protein
VLCQIMGTMKFPAWHEAPEEILRMDGHCGLVAAWTVLHFFGKPISVPQIVKSCWHTKRYGVFTVNMAAGLKEHGLKVSFHSEPDDDIGSFEKHGYARAHRLGITVEPAVDLPVLLRERKRGRIPIVLFDTAANSGQFRRTQGTSRP